MLLSIISEPHLFFHPLDQFEIIVLYIYWGMPIGMTLVTNLTIFFIIVSIVIRKWLKLSSYGGKSNIKMFGTLWIMLLSIEPHLLFHILDQFEIFVSYIYRLNVGMLKGTIGIRENLATIWTAFMTTSISFMEFIKIILIIIHENVLDIIPKGTREDLENIWTKFMTTLIIFMDIIIHNLIEIEELGLDIITNYEPWNDSDGKFNWYNYLCYHITFSLFLIIVLDFLKGLVIRLEELENKFKNSEFYKKF